MTTAIQMITRSMRLAGIIGKGESLDTDEADDGLVALNSMLDSWSIERLFAYYMVQETLNVVANQATYTMGVGGDLNTTRPTRIEDDAYITFASIDYHIKVINVDAYASIPAKTVQSNIPLWLYVSYQNPLVKLTFYPVQNTSGVVTLWSWKQLQQFTTLTDVLALPPGNERAITYSLAEEFGPEFGVQIDPRVSAIAMKARGNLKRINAPSPVMSSEVGYMGRLRKIGNILSGQT